MNLTLNVDLTEEICSAVEQISDLNERVSWFLSEQVALEQWRSDRQLAEDRDIAAQIVREAEASKQGGASQQEIAERFLKRWDQVMSSIRE